MGTTRGKDKMKLRKAVINYLKKKPDNVIDAYQLSAMYPSGKHNERTCGQLLKGMRKRGEIVKVGGQCIYTLPSTTIPGTIEKKDDLVLQNKKPIACTDEYLVIVDETVVQTEDSMDAALRASGDFISAEYSKVCIAKVKKLITVEDK